MSDELIGVVQRLSFCRDVGAVMCVLRDAARRLSGADGVTVIFREGDLCHYADESAIGPLWKGRRFPMQSCISGWCMINRQQVTISDIYLDERIPHDAYRPTFVKSLAMVPIRSEDPIGAVGAYWANHHQATEAELRVLQALADSASIAIATVQLIETLQEQNRRKDEFISMLGHELRNPLAPLRNALHVLHDRGEHQDVARQSWEIMDRQVRHMTRIIDDLLDVSRLTRGSILLQRERLDLSRLVRQCVDDRWGLLEEAGLIVEVEVPQTPVWVMGDATRLTQVLDNLLDNSRKFTPRGGNVAVRLRVDLPSKTALISIRDSGIGIDPQILPNVFDVFAQADRSLDRAQGGLGLGLSVAKGLLALHEGTIEARSEGKDRGSEFVIRLPRQSELPALAAGPVAARSSDKRLRVLVIEDNRDSAESLRLLLTIRGFEVSVAHTGTAGVEAAMTHRPQIVLCDLGLPEMDGFAVAAALRRMPQTAQSRLIAITGYGQPEDTRRALEAGFDLHLVKPVDPQRLLDELATAA